MKYESELKKIGKWGSIFLKHAAHDWARACRNIGRKAFSGMRIAGAKLILHRETLGYYAVLTLVLVALGVAANDYRDRKSTQSLLSALSTADPGLVVQSRPDPTLEPQAQTPTYVLPVDGTCVGTFCDEALTWSASLQLWQTHPAVDIAAPAGVAVVSAAQGTVIDAYDDSIWGNCIVVEHEDGRTLRYSSLSTLQLVEIGQAVAQGEIISAVGTCNAESELGTHVHLEFEMNGQLQDLMRLMEEDSSE